MKADAILASAELFLFYLHARTITKYTPKHKQGTKPICSLQQVGVLPSGPVHWPFSD